MGEKDGGGGSSGRGDAGGRAEGERWTRPGAHEKGTRETDGSDGGGKGTDGGGGLHLASTMAAEQVTAAPALTPRGLSSSSDIT